MVGDKTKRINNSFMTIFDILKLWQEHPTLCRTMARLLTVSIIQFREDSTYSFTYLSARCINTQKIILTTFCKVSTCTGVTGKPIAGNHIQLA